MLQRTSYWLHQEQCFVALLLLRRLLKRWENTLYIQLNRISPFIVFELYKYSSLRLMSTPETFCFPDMAIWKWFLCPVNFLYTEISGMYNDLWSLTAVAYFGDLWLEYQDVCDLNCFFLLFLSQSHSSHVIWRFTGISLLFHIRVAIISLIFVVVVI